MAVPDVAVVFPWRKGCPYREAAFTWVRDQYRAAHPDWDLVVGLCADDRPFNRSEAIMDGARRTTAGVIVVADSDVWCDGVGDAVAHVEASGWAIPHWYIHRLSRESTSKVLAGEDWHGLPLSHDNKQDSRPYRGNESGTLTVFTRDLLFDVPYDRRFVGWGQEDDAHATALRSLAGKAWRARHDLVHLWHPPQPRKSRAVGTPENFALLRRYRAASRNPDQLRELIAEGANHVR